MLLNGQVNGLAVHYLGCRFRPPERFSERKIWRFEAVGLVVELAFLRILTSPKPFNEMSSEVVRMNAARQGEILPISKKGGEIVAFSAKTGRSSQR